MAVDRKGRAAVIYLVVGALVVAWYLLLYTRLCRPIYSSAGASVSVAPVQASQPGGEPRPTVQHVQTLIEKALAFERVKRLELPSGMRDPFQPPRAERPAPPKPRPEPRLEFALNAILWCRTEPVALINGRVVRPGDAVGTGITVSRIDPTGVTLSYRFEGKLNHLRLPLNPG